MSSQPNALETFLDQKAAQIFDTVKKEGAGALFAGSGSMLRYAQIGTLLGTLASGITQSVQQFGVSNLFFPTQRLALSQIDFKMMAAGALIGAIGGLAYGALKNTISKKTHTHNATQDLHVEPKIGQPIVQHSQDHSLSGAHQGNPKHTNSTDPIQNPSSLGTHKSSQNSASDFFEKDLPIQYQQLAVRRAQRDKLRAEQFKNALEQKIQNSQEQQPKPLGM